MTARAARPALASLALAALLLAALRAPAARAEGTLALASRDGLDAWAVGDSGRWYRTLDGGATWGFGALGTKPLRAVAARARRVLVAGDSGLVWRSGDAGGTWAVTAIPGAPALRAIDLADDSTGWLAGDAGTLVRVRARGDSLLPLATGWSAHLLAARAVDAQHAWVAGTSGFAARTTDGGAHWTAVPLPTANDLRSIDVLGGRVWIVGDGATALRSTDGGASFAAVDLGLLGRSDLRAVHLAGADTVWLAGGGGFVRRSTDSGATWTWPVQPLVGPVSALCFSGTHAFLASRTQRAVSRSADRGATWALPTGATTTRSWSQKLPLASGTGRVRGSTLAMNPVHASGFYCMLGYAAGSVKLWRSLDEGDTWAQLGPTLAAPSRANSFVVSPRDSNVMLAAVSDPGQVLRSTDGGQSWAPTLSMAFGEFGSPLAQHVLRPDTLFFGGDTSVVLRSTDMGQSWAPWGSTVFREPCDIKVVPDGGETWILADGVTDLGVAQVWRSTDAGATWSLRYTGTGQASEVPTIAVSALAPSAAFLASWRTGGILRSTDTGGTWATTFNVQPAWGVDIARDDPNVVFAGLYGGGASYVSMDGGTTWTYVPLNGANYAFLARDRALVLAEQSSGVWKLSTSHGFTPSNVQSIALTAPATGVTWDPGTVQVIAWNPVNVALARVEYRTGPAQPWQWIADVDGELGQYAWTVPKTPAPQAALRVSDAWDGSPADSSAVPFTISTVAVAPPAARGLDLAAPRPNPFGARVTLAYRLPAAGRVALELFDLQGHRVARLVDAWQEPGEHAASLDATHALPPGVYLARLSAPGGERTRKLVRLER